MRLVWSLNSRVCGTNSPVLAVAVYFSRLVTGEISRVQLLRVEIRSKANEAATLACGVDQTVAAIVAHGLNERIACHCPWRMTRVSRACLNTIMKEHTVGWFRLKQSPH